LTGNTPRIKRSPTFVSSIAALALTFSVRAVVTAELPCPCANGYGTDEDHIVQVNADGEFVPARQPRTNKKDERLDDLFDCIKKSGRTRIILYVHGGRVSLGAAVKTAKRLSPIIANEENDKKKKDAYPIFFCWDTEQFSSYFRHLAYERNGVSYRGSYAATTSALVAPLVLGADIGRGLTRLPINTTLSLGKLSQNFDLILGHHSVLFPVRKKYEEQLAPLVCPKEPRQAIKEGFVYDSESLKPRKLHLAVGQDAQHYQLKLALQFAATLPFQFTTEPVIDSVGTPAWGNMLRRTRSMFHLSTNYVSQPQPQTRTDYPAGAGAMFFERLRKLVKDDPKHQTKLEIYAHSMGTIVINEAYAKFPDLPAKPIVFMAAACSIRDFASTTGEYIAASKTPFYNLSLHPRAELDDVEALGLPVRGSLLVWIDEFFEDPKSFGDRTLGTLENIVIAQDFLPKGTPIYLKAFPIEDGKGKRDKREGDDLYRGPQRHGEFENYYFWQEQFRCTAKATDFYKRTPKESPVPTPCGAN